MRSAWRTIAPARRQSMIVTALMVGVIGISYGATAVSSGFPLWFPVVLATTVVAGSSEFVLIGILAAGGGVPAAVAAGLLLNLRPGPMTSCTFMPYGRWRRPGDSHLLNHATLAFALAHTPPPRPRSVESDAPTLPPRRGAARRYLRDPHAGPGPRHQTPSQRAGQNPGRRLGHRAPLPIHGAHRPHDRPPLQRPRPPRGR